MIFPSPPPWGGEAGRGGERNAVETENADRTAPAPRRHGCRQDPLASLACLRRSEALRLRAGRRERVVSWKFRRQHPIGRRIADVACPARKLVIEFDGGQHAERRDADDRRGAGLAADGYRVIWFWNNEVLENLDGVRETIRRELPHLSRPLRPEGRRGEDLPECEGHQPGTTDRDVCSR